MTRFLKTSMSRRDMVGSAFLVLVVMIAAMPTRAEARVRVSVALSTPDVQLVVNSGDRGYRPIERHYVVIDRADYRIARSLARRYDCPRAVLIDMRRDGYSWAEIRAILNLPSHQAYAVLYPYEQGYWRHDADRDRRHHRHERYDRHDRCDD